MPHIDGHIEGLPGSPGIIKITAYPEKGIWFVPDPDFDPASMNDKDIGFHLLEIPTAGESVLIAYDVILKTKTESEKGKAMDARYENTAEFTKFYKDSNGVARDQKYAIDQVKDKLLDLVTLKEKHEKIKKEKEEKDKGSSKQAA